MLWITFKSCIFAFWNNTAWLAVNTYLVVNYIQILYLCILKQQNIVGELYGRCCELHSNLVSLHSETTMRFCVSWRRKLWITFKSCIFAFWNNRTAVEYKPWIVVNYIQILYLCILKQLGAVEGCHDDSCELHSNLVSLHSETTCLATNNTS